MAPSPPPPFGPLCLASPADILRIGIVASAGFHSSSVFDYERPNHANVPQDTLLSYRHEFSSLIKSPEHIVLVATDKFDPNEQKNTKAIISPNNGWPTPKSHAEAVVGVACWKLQPGSDRKGSFQNNDAPYPDLLENTKRDIDKDRCDALEERCKAVEEQYFQGLITLEMVVVHPAYRKCGHGRRLVQWGIDLATRDKVRVGVIAAKEGKSFYCSLGFEELEGLHHDSLALSVMQYDEVKSG